MKHLFPFFALLLVTVSSCKKEEVEEPENKYDIHMVDWSAVYSGAYDWEHFDINGDGASDFEFRSYYYSERYDSAGYDVYKVIDLKYLNQIDTTYKLAVFDEVGGSNLFLLDETINVDSDWVASYLLYIKRWWDHPSSSNNSIIEYNYPFEPNNGIGYLAIKREIDGDTFYGWLHVKVEVNKMTFYKSAFNRIPNVPIRMGQEN